MNIEEVLSTTHRISPRERVPFHCTCCGECCRHVRQSVPLESPDVFRLTRLLREKDKGIICMDDFIARYTELALLDECGYFMLMLKVTGVDDACIFLKENRCMVHAAKPRTCRIYPFVAGIGDDGQPGISGEPRKGTPFQRPGRSCKGMDETAVYRGRQSVSQNGSWFCSGYCTTHAADTRIPSATGDAPVLAI